MSEAQKEITSRLAAAISKLPEKDGMYILGRAEAQADMIKENKKEEK